MQSGEAMILRGKRAVDWEADGSVNDNVAIALPVLAREVFNLGSENEKKILEDLENRSGDWLRPVADAMLKATNKDYHDWQKYWQ
jgi:hypothetical protein